MTVCYIFRPKDRKGHSIENVFHTISQQMEKNRVKTIIYFSKKSLWKTLKQLRTINADIYHVTGDVYYLAIFLPRKKTIVTVHDIGAYKNFPKTIKSYIFALLWFILPLWKMKYITAISQLTKNDLVSTFRINSEKIKVIENPVSIPIKRTSYTFSKEKPTILQIGTGVHKNLIGLIEAVKSIPCKLEIVGNPSIDLLQKMDEYKIEYHITTGASEEQIIQKYEQCDMLYFASLSEGFGLPIIEAQTAGRPVITSRLAPMPEVAGLGAILVDPHSVDEIRQAISDIINDDSLRTGLIEIGIRNVERFSPQKIADDYLSFYKSIEYGCM